MDGKLCFSAKKTCSFWPLSLQKRFGQNCILKKKPLLAQDNVINGYIELRPLCNNSSILKLTAF